MQKYIPYFVVVLLYLLLFIKAKGFFSAAARLLLDAFPHHHAITMHAVKTALLFLFLFNLLAAGVTWKTELEDTVSEGYLLRNSYGEAASEEELEILWEGEKREIELTLPSRKLTDSERSELMARAKSALKEELAGEGITGEENGTFLLYHDLTYPEALADLPVRISWRTDHPEYLDFAGHITESVPEAGADVTLTASIVLEEEVEEVSFSLRVFPAQLTEEEKLNQKITAAVSDQNDESEEKVILPSEIEGKPVRWFSREDQTGITLLMMGGLIGVLYLYSRVKRSDEEEEKRLEKMKKEYPGIIMKLVLLMNAGVSLRGAFHRIAADYVKRDDGEEKPGYEELLRTVQEMEHGIPEIEAYRNLGRRCKASEYRTFSSVIAQNLQKGGSELIRILEREASEAQEGRKKRARILGEEAGTKLLLPMLMMLAIVMAILMVPAYLSFA